MKKSLNSDDQLFHQYQQNEQAYLSQFTEHEKIPLSMTLKIQVMAWDRHHNVAGFTG